MRVLIIISAIFMQFSWSHGYPGAQNGVGAFAYQDSAGNRYGGTYGLKDGQVFRNQGDSFQDLPFGLPTFPELPGFPDVDDFFPEYFRNFENLLQEAFGNHLEQQKVALNAAQKAYDLTSNQAGYNSHHHSGYNPSYGPNHESYNRNYNSNHESYIPNYNSNQAGYNENFNSRLNSFGRMPGFGNFAMPDFGDNSAFASGMAGPGFTHQVAAINPTNPGMRNIDVTSFGDAAELGKPNFYSVSTKSFSSSSDINGQKTNDRGAETLVNNNGKITGYKLRS